MPRQPELLFGATKAIPINELPEAAWRVISGDEDKDVDVISLRKTVGIFRRCLDIRSAAVASVPWSIRTTGSTSDPLWSSDISTPPSDLKWLKNIKSLLRLAETSLLLRSEAFWYIHRTIGGKPYDIRWLSPLHIKPIWDATDGIIHYERDKGKGTKEILDVSDVCYIWMPDPMHETRPDEPLALAAANAAATLRNIDIFTQSFFQRGAIKATLLTVEGTPEPNAIKLLKEWWDRVIRGVKNSWGTEVFTGAVKPVVVGEGIRELSNSELDDEKRRAIATTFGIPHSMVFSDSANYATAAVDKRNFYDETIAPELDLIEPLINEQLFEGTNLTFHFDLESLDIFQEDENERADALTKYVGAGVPLYVAGAMLGIELPNNMQWSEFKLTEQPSQSASSESEPSAPSQAEAGSTPVDESLAKPAKAKADDLARWQRKALNRLASDGNASCSFESTDITPFENHTIGLGLTRASTRDEVKAVFDPYFNDSVMYQEAAEYRSWLADRIATGDSFKLNDWPLRHVTPAMRRAIFVSLIGAARDGPDALDELNRSLEELDSHPKRALTLQANGEDDDDERDALQSVEDRATKAIAKGLSDQGKAVFDGNDDMSASVDEVDMGALLAAPERATSVMSASDALRAALIESADLGVTMASAQLETLKLSFDWTLPNIEARDWAQAHSGALISGINATTQRGVQQAIAQWVENGEPLRALERELRPFFGRSRAELIASTEVTRAYAEANRIAYRSTGIVSEMEWQTAFDERVCPICGPLNETRVSLDGAFAAAFEVPPAHPRCRCILLPVIDRDRIVQQAA